MNPEALNLRATIEPKSDQMNADDLIGTTRDITVTAVKASGAPDQPISIHYEGDNGRPYKPCKSMRRVLIHCWGDNGADWIGQSMRLYCDPEVKFGGVKVGGIRISNVTGIDKTLVFSLTVTKAKRAEYRVDPMPKPYKPTDYPSAKFDENLGAWVEAINNGKATVAKIVARLDKAGERLTDEQLARLDSAVEAAMEAAG